MKDIKAMINQIDDSGEIDAIVKHYYQVKMMDEKTGEARMLSQQ